MQAIAATCNGLSVLFTNLTGAADLQRTGEIDQAQFNAITRVSLAGIRALQQQAAEHQYGLIDQLEALLDAAVPPDGGDPKGEAFDPSSEVFGSARRAVTGACEANGTPVAVWAVVAGG
ncbi:hypothetical protein [Protaetiibacter intestinalis]|uniref:Uncharacterized protein n=1 Tax=Protaetiibacter intestinalis TaxID=2419774 RepID=A0A387B4G8_9MICO|nr:hypothetical protein [Protaetiibacter intestinalis]AYF97207.1 hypothetical protein D7I47_02375 [Protaetiibacter intestinalis]